ncbi:hypothetical protein EV363DRAFT_1397865 [Boletus edulis]|nr:hypothetical protein EV363DRAFT_1397865 [Boletus edulis]
MNGEYNIDEDPHRPPANVLHSATSWAVDQYPNAGRVTGDGQTLLTRFELDHFSAYHKLNLYYLMRAISEFLSLKLTKTLPLSFWSAKELHSHAEMLPLGPAWRFRIVPTTTHPTKQPVHLYYRDPLDCIEALFNNPLFASEMDLSPYRFGTLCGVILSSDKMTITNMCGGQVAHPLLISLANIRMKTHNKALSHAFLLLTLMPIPRFIHPTTRICSVLEAWLFHQCLDIVLEPLKIAACIGKMMSDPAGNLHYCFTPLVSYIVDMPEAAMLACIWGQTSSVTLAKYDQFGNPNTCETRTGALTMTQLQSLETDPAAVERYFTKCERYHLSGALHHWHHFFWDHELRWCIEALGAGELDFRFSVLPLVTGLRHFSHGVTKLKQVTGRTQRDAQRYIVVVLSGFPDTNVVATIWALMDFRYLAQALVISSITRNRIAVALAEFHQHKQAILNHGLRRGPQTNAPLEHFNIPKLEMMHNVVPSVSNVGSILQWTADTTEHAHIEVIKNPAAITNNMNYNAQICCTLDCDEKCRLFNIAISLSQQYKDMENGELWSESPHHQTTNLFAAAPGTIPRPLRVFVSGSTAFHLNREPSIRHVSIDDAAQKFNIPDLRGAFGDYLNREGRFTRNFHVFGGPRRSPQDVPLPFNELRIWYKLRLQQKLYHDLSTLGLAFTVHAHPPDQTWKYGHYSGALLNVDEAHAWPSSGLAGM